MFAVLFFVGVGSFGLHSTLHWLPQSSDEVPMLWQCWTLLFAMTERNTAIGGSSRTAIVMLGLAIMQTFIYYSFRDLYAAFLISYIALVVIVSVWSSIITFENPDKKIRSSRFSLWIRSTTYFIWIGSVIWVVDNKYCHELLPYYHAIGGLTMHVLWHFFAGYACLHTITLLILVRLQDLGRPVSIAWKMGFIPVCVLPPNTKLE